MCNIAGYTGSRPAAPILIDMMRRQEGWDAGCYTGIVTIHEDRMDFVKATGDLDHLVQNSRAAELQGSIGLMHSRTPSGGDDEWAHPFIGYHDQQPYTAYVANGSQGFFSDRLEEASQIAGRLENSGFPFSSRTSQQIGRYPTLPDGDFVHMSDVMAQLITSKVKQGTDVSEAMTLAFCEMPAEIVGLFLSLTEPECIAWSRINMPMFVAFAPHGAYLASTPQAFPADAGEPVLLPACSSGKVCCDCWTANPYPLAPAKVASITPRVWHEAYTAIEAVLANGPETVPELVQIVKPLFDSADCSPNAAVVYSILYELQKQNRLITDVSRVSGVRDDLSAPLFRARLL